MQFSKKLAIVMAAVALVSSARTVAAVDVVESSCKCVALDESSPVLSTIDANATASYFPQECQADGEEGTTYLCTFEQAGPKEGFIGWFCRKFSKNWSCGFL